MSNFVSEILPEGIFFAADINLTISKLDAQGNVICQVQDHGSKILRWPKRKALIGYVGRAKLGNESM